MARIEDIPFHERIRNRRAERRMAAYELAEKAGISPSYVSLIESGAKVPGEEVAEAIARALDDDPDLYRAWTRLAGSEDLQRTLSGADQLRQISTDSGLRRRLADGGNLDLAGMSRAATGRTARHPDTAGPIDVPVLEESADPGDGPLRTERVVETLHLDRRVFPGGKLVRPFAYRVGEDGVQRVRGLIHPGDLVVLTSRVKAPSPGRVYAVRLQGKVVLSRVLLKKEAMLLLPPEGGSDFEMIPVRGRGAAAKRLAGMVVLSVRAWE